MKNRLIKLLWLLVVVTTSAWAQSYPVSDGFSGAGALSANWTNIQPVGLSYPPVALVQAGGTVVPVTSGQWGMAVYTGATFNNDQYAQARFTGNPSISSGTGPCVRMSVNGNAYCYAVDLGQIVAFNGGIYGQRLVTNCPIPASGDIVQISAVGTTITCTDVTTGASSSGVNTTYWLNYGSPGVMVDSNALAEFQSDCVPSCSSTTPAVTPAFSPTGGSYSSAQTVTISTTTPGATIYYTTDGSTPTTSSTVYSAPLVVAASETVKAIAAASGFASSAVGSATYVITSNFPVADGFGGTGALSSNWTNIQPTGLSYPPVALVQAGGTVVPSTSGQWGMAVYTGATFNNDQYAQARFLGNPALGGGTGPCVRMSVGGNAYCYGVTLGQIIAFNGGNWGQRLVTNCPIPSSGDTVQISAVGTTITCTDVTTGASASGINTTYWLDNGLPGVMVDSNALAQFQADCVPSCGSGGGGGTTPAATPAFSPAGGNYTSAQAVTISTSTPGATIYYTTDGSTPTTSSAAYSSPIAVSVSETIKAVATASGFTSSAVSSATYAIVPVTNPGTTWYVRADGGTRYSANAAQGQCDGKADAPYSGSGVNQHCAFNDVRFLWDDQHTYGVRQWVIAGGDTVILRNGPWRIGFDQGASPNDVWCQGGDGPTSCGMATIPAGTPTQHTRILGENYASCGSKSQMTQLFGGFGLGSVLWLPGTQYVDVQCIELTRHSNCIQHGVPAVPSICSDQYPFDDFAAKGVVTDVNTHDVLMQDMWIHGFTDRGVLGPLGGVLTCLRCDIAYNGMAGWDFDDGTGSNNGNGTASLPTAVWNFTNSIIEWSGCNQEYPATDAIPVMSCYAQNTGGYGDGVGSPPGGCLTANVNGSTFRYNMQDAADLGHYDTNSCAMTITNSTAYGNLGGTFKWGAAENPAIFENNIAIANGFRLSQPLTGLNSSVTSMLASDPGDMCRAGDAVSFNFEANGVAVMNNNTVVNACTTSFDIGCWASTNCSAASFTFQNNLVLGYDDPATYNNGGQAGGPGGIGYQEPIGTVVRNNNLFYGIRNLTCPTGYTGEICLSPELVNQPAGTGGNFVQSELDNFNAQPTQGSPAVGAGVTYTGMPTTDYSGATRPNPPSIGALEP